MRRAEGTAFVNSGANGRHSDGFAIFFGRLCDELGRFGGISATGTLVTAFLTALASAL